MFSNQFFSETDNPERRLIAAILFQAVHDALLPEYIVTQADHARAISFLTQKAGAFAKTREMYCDCIDLDGERLRRWVIDILEGAPFDSGAFVRERALTESKEQKAAEKLTMARATWAASKPKDPPKMKPEVEPTADRGLLEKRMTQSAKAQAVLHAAVREKERKAAITAKARHDSQVAFAEQREANLVDCYEISDAGYVFCQHPPDNARLGNYAIPKPNTMPGKVARALTKQRGLTVVNLRSISRKYGLSTMKALARRHGFEIAPVTYEGVPCAFDEAYRFHLAPGYDTAP